MSTSAKKSADEIHQKTENAAKEIDGLIKNNVFIRQKGMSIFYMWNLLGAIKKILNGTATDATDEMALRWFSEKLKNYFNAPISEYLLDMESLDAVLDLKNMVSENKYSSPVFYREREVCLRIGISSASLRLMILKRNFPKPIKISGNIQVWDSEIVHDWMRAKVLETHREASEKLRNYQIKAEVKA